MERPRVLGGQGKTRPRVRRRTILWGAASLALTAIGGAAWYKRYAIRLYLANRPHEGPELTESPVGALGADEKNSLWELVSAIGARWSMRDLGREDFDSVVDLKTTAAPSYLSEYRSAIALFEGLRREGKDAHAAFAAILRGERGAAGAFTPMAHAQDWVLAEFMNLYLARGGFRQYGFANYRGFAGGPLGYRTFRG